MGTSEETRWVEPTQARSREKVQRILAATEQLALSNGSLNVKMTDVAKAARVAIGTLYQFFPSRTALMAKLFDEAMAPINTAMEQLLDQVDDFDMLTERLETLLGDHLVLVRSRPVLSLVWGSSAIAPEIQAADLRNTHKNTALLSARLRELLPTHVDAQQLEATAMLVCHLWGAVVRLSASCDDAKAHLLVRQYAGMVAAQGATLAAC